MMCRIERAAQASHHKHNAQRQQAAELRKSEFSRLLALRVKNLQPLGANRFEWILDDGRAYFVAHDLPQSGVAKIDKL